MKRLEPGDRPPRGAIITLYHGEGDSRTAKLWFHSDGSFICPRTVNGHWWGAETLEEIDRQIAEYV